MVALHPDRRTILVGLAILAIAFFIVPTRVHERYLYPFFIVGAILAAISWRWRIAWLVLAAANFLNLYVVLTTLYPGNPSIIDWLGIGPAIRDPKGVTVIVLLHVAVFVWAVIQLRPGARRALAEEVEEAGRISEPATPVPVHVPAPALVPAAAMAAGPTGGPSAGGTAFTVGVEGGTDPTGSPGSDGPDPGAVAVASRLGVGVAAPGWLDGVRSRIDSRPTRPDRSRGLHGEGGGRLERLDLWVVIVLVIAALAFRTFRLAEPLTMHFDEVYHARTATEFLQGWRYGIDHDIYEYTHPHVAKYAMAVGIVLFGQDKVSATSDLDVPVKDAAVEPRWDDPSLPGGRAGDRLYVATGDEVRAYDLATRGLVATIPAPGASAVAIGARDHKLYIGTGVRRGPRRRHVDRPRRPPWRLAGSLRDPRSVRAGRGPGQPPDRLRRRRGRRGDDPDRPGRDARRDRRRTSSVEPPSTASPSSPEAGPGDALIAQAGEIGDPVAVAAELARSPGHQESDYQGHRRLPGPARSSCRTS